MAKKIRQNSMRFLWWLRYVLFWWARPAVVPDDPKQELQLDPTKPVCYILNIDSLSDLLVLDEICRRFKLPLPHNRRKDLLHPQASAYIYLRKRGLVQVVREKKDAPPSPLLRVIKMVDEHPEHDVQLVPVSVFWGRNPGKTERSWYKLLFFDDEHAGVLQKFFIVLAQGRSCFLNIGKPISVRKVVDEGAGLEQTSKKIRRVLKVHFRTQRINSMGPQIPSRNDVVRTLLGTKNIKEAIADEARKQNISNERAEARAAKYLYEISADPTPSIVRLFDVFLTWTWNKMFNGVSVKHSHRLREMPKDAEIIYLPSHRSHMDYLLLAYTLYYQVVSPPHTAAGVNLDFWPVGTLLRKGGAFYIRRKFSGNRLYATVFSEYVHYLVSNGHSMKFYIEGGRSRTGKLLQPKTGMLSMVVQSYLRSRERPIMLVPVYVGYDKVMEVATYQKELRGSSKKRESLSQLLNAKKALKSNFGKAYIGFGKPINLGDYLATHVAEFTNERLQPGEKPVWLNRVVQDLGRKVLTEVNSTAVVSSVALVAIVLLASPQRAIAEDDLLFLLDKLLEAMRTTPYSEDVSTPEDNAQEILAAAMKVYPIGKFQHPGGNVVYLEETETILLTYYKNNIAHLLALPSLLASFFQHQDSVSEEEMIDACKKLYPFLMYEYFLRWDIANIETAAKQLIATLCNQGLLIKSGEGDLITRPDVSTREFAALKLLGRVIGQTLERYAISATMLGHAAAKQPVSRAGFEAQCQLMAQRLAILNGVQGAEFFDKNLFKVYIDLLKELKYVKEDEQGHIHAYEHLGEIAQAASRLLSTDIKQSIQRSVVIN